MTIYNCKGAWYDRQGRRHNFEIESDRAERSFIKELVESRYPTDRVVIKLFFKFLNHPFYCWTFLILCLFNLTGPALFVVGLFLYLELKDKDPVL